MFLCHGFLTPPPRLNLQLEHFEREKATTNEGEGTRFGHVIPGSLSRARPRRTANDSMWRRRATTPLSNGAQRRRWLRMRRSFCTNVRQVSLMERPRTRGYVKSISKSVAVNHSRSKIYSVVADVSAYRHFLPFCVKSDVDEATRIKDMQGRHIFDCMLEFRHLPHFQESILHRVALDSPAKIVSQARDTQHCHWIEYDWGFSEIDDHSSQVSLRLELDLKSIAYAMGFDMMRETIEDRVFRAFLERTNSLKH